MFSSPVTDQDAFFIKLAEEFWGDVVGDVEGDRHLHPSPVHRVHLVFHPQDLPASRGGMSRPISARHRWGRGWVGCRRLSCWQFRVNVDLGHPPRITSRLCSIVLRLPWNLPFHRQHVVSLLVTVASIFIPSFRFILGHDFLKSNFSKIVSNCQTSEPSWYIELVLNQNFPLKFVFSLNFHFAVLWHNWTTFQNIPNIIDFTFKWNLFGSFDKWLFTF